MSKFFEIFGTPHYTGFMAGVEYEVESVQKVYTNPTYILNVTSDDSLRNSGVEVITLPLSYQQAVDSHKWLFTGGLVLTDPSEACTELGSIHVHVNFSDQPEEKVQQFIRLYALMEPYFFDAVAEHRHNNIYCVPVSATNMLRMAMNGIGSVLTDKWHKYCAFNVKPLAQYGTIEFRHLQITSDHAVFENWMQLIHRLYTFNLENEAPPVVSPSFLKKFVVTVTGNPFLTYGDINSKLELTQVNDLLLMVNPNTQLISTRIKQNTKEAA